VSDVAQRPTDDNREAWRAYWTAQGMPWRWEPEIDQERQQYLAQRRAIKPDIERGLYPFRDAHGGIKLDRADVEWLLESHESGGMRGPVDWSIEKQREREGLDLRGADLASQDLHDLPLARMRGGMSADEVPGISPGEVPGTSRAQREMAAAQFQHASLSRAHLEGAALRRAHFQGADLTSVHLEDAYLYKAHFEGAYLRNAHLEGANLQLAFFDTETALDYIVLGQSAGAGTRLVDVHWSDVNLAVVPWSRRLMLGDERLARARRDTSGTLKPPARRLRDFEAAVRAHRQLATALSAQGLREQAAWLGYRAERLQTVVFRRQRHGGQWLFAKVLDVIAGYGYQPWKAAVWYVGIVIAFAAVYLALAPASLHLTPIGAVVTSMVSFHGRGFFPGQPDVNGPFMRFVAGEALCGLLLEITFIATFTQRFFAR
jgi:hypothetical protein